MYRISELAEQVGLSRTTLLYYEKLGLIEGKRLSNGYRVYSEYDVQRLRLIQQLHAGGLTLNECKACLNARIDREVLLNRLSQLDDEIAEKHNARRLLSALLGEKGHKEWHETIDRVAPDAHLDWLIKQGFNEQEALRLKWLSKNMNEHERYMADFLRVYEALDRWGPGSDSETLKALSKIPFTPKKILEVGCGNGVASFVLAEQSEAQITAVDNDAPALARLVDRAREVGVDHKIMMTCASMMDLPFKEASFDVIWSEGSAYIMGVTKALKEWKAFLEDGGILVFSDLVWLTNSPSEEVAAYWEKAYPEMATVDERVKQSETEGYEVVDSFTLNEEAWSAYFEPLQARVNSVKDEMMGSPALKDIEGELASCRQYPDEFGYQMFVLRRV